MLCLGMYIWFVNPELPEFTCLGGHKFQFQNLAQFQSFFLAHGKMTAHDLSFQIQFASPTFRTPIFIFLSLLCSPNSNPICLDPPLLLVFIAPKLFVLAFQVCFISYFLFLFWFLSLTKSCDNLAVVFLKFILIYFVIWVLFVRAYKLWPNLNRIFLYYKSLVFCILFLFG